MARKSRTGSFRASKGPRRKGAISSGGKRKSWHRVYEGYSAEQRDREQKERFMADPAAAAAAAAALTVQPEADGSIDTAQKLRRKYHKMVAAEELKQFVPDKLGAAGSSFLTAWRAEVAAKSIFEPAGVSSSSGTVPASKGEMLKKLNDVSNATCEAESANA
mmetsp:Transcript_20936/g.34574  ORF Transcript_20936/g.34574 Transcript_20936/m.34574 type:complete len:162 (+) Transcript_20936:190-675(+)|eukprot:CAMPEP_0119303334 /NCGR_PEP_ID=MMETSP1333-20130426/4787_1 /TAXON_ID=418940 /ORGANISM="Scyphosphaera apsteinii, Strain RCC1455" /LENGTH=161 /DNA_ID=CAMNT_0007305983 /DNA_START=171 /DNA_END=656 /DNA_ORIENTATION=-